MIMAAGTTIGAVQTIMNDFYPPETAESWDRVGLVCGDRTAPVSRVLLTVDVTDEVIDQAIGIGANLIISHHPLLLRGINDVDPLRPKGRMITTMITERIGLITAHTNADIPPGGVADSLASALGLSETRPLAATPDRPDTGMGRVGTIAPVDLAGFAERVAAALPGTPSGVRVAGDPGRMISTVALQGGAGDDLLDAARHAAADVYLTSDLRHHPAAEAIAHPDAPALIDVPHWAAEWTWLPNLQQQLTTRAPDLKVTISEHRTDPWTFVTGRPRS